MISLLFCFLAQAFFLHTPTHTHKMSLSNFPSCLATEEEEEEEEEMDTSNLMSLATPLLTQNKNSKEVEQGEAVTASTMEAATSAAAELVRTNNNSNDIGSSSGGSMMIMTPEDEEKWLGKYFSTSSSASPMVAAEDNTTMSSLERDFEESMQLASSALAMSSASLSKTSQQMSEDAMRKVYAELHSQADPETIDKLKMAMECIPASNCKVGTVY